MAIFGAKKKVVEKKAVSVKAGVTAKKAASPASTSKLQPASSSTPTRSLANILTRPRITEKAANMTAMSVYTFDISKRATKRDVFEAVEALYKVKPVKVNVVNTPGKPVRLRKKRGFGRKAATRKALVFLKKGQTIELT